FLLNLSNYPGGVSRNVGPSHGEPLRDAFESTADLKNRGSTGSEIYYFALNNASTDAPPPSPATNVPGDSNNPAACLTANITAFDTLATSNGLPGTARQVVLWDRVTRRFVELARGTANSTNPAIDHLGRTVVFQSAADLK